MTELERDGGGLALGGPDGGLAVTGDRFPPADGGARADAPDQQPDQQQADQELITTLRSLREQGRFEQAAAHVRLLDATPPGPDGRPGRLGPAAHEVAGQALAAVSDHAGAQAHLTLALAGDDPDVAASALARLAELAWVQHQHERGRELALTGLALDPSHRGCRNQLQRNERSSAERAAAAARAAAGRPALVSHAAFFADPQGNAGDRALTDAVRHCFTGAGGSGAPGGGVSGPADPGWQAVHVHQLFDDERLAAVNATAGLVVGGGGLFLPDTAPNGNSGWQWNVPDDVLAKIDVPLVVFAVGYNMFAGQTFEPDGRGGRFTRSLRTLVERATFIGLRNHGSVERVRELLPPELAERVVWQPCPTTFTDLFTDVLTDPSTRTAHAGPAADVLDRSETAGPERVVTGPAVVPGAVLLNCAYDRAGRRFGDRYGDFLAALHDWVRRTRERAEIRFAAHCVDDERLVADLRREYGVTLPVIPMFDLEPDRIHAHYRQASLVVGMRGHAGMVPFGVGTPIISLISHPKLGYFLDDIGRREWGVDVQDPALAGRLWEQTTAILDDQAGVRADIAAIRNRLAQVTDDNLSQLPIALRPARRLAQPSITPSTQPSTGMDRAPGDGARGPSAAGYGG